MLKRENRFTGKVSLKKANTIISPLFIVKYIEINEGESKFAFTVSKKIDKRAVYRNKIKRIIAETVRKNLVNLKKQILAIFIVKSFINEVPKSDIEKEVNKFFAQINK